jgi:outer membrane biosynthesis protein TonB
MKIVARFILLSVVLAPGRLVQTQLYSSSPQPDEVQIAAKVAEKMLIHKVEPDACPHVAMAARVIGTVVVAIRIGRNGDVIYTKVISGPQTLRKAVLDAVRKYKYHPYLLNFKAVDVDTTVSVTVDQLRARGCP